MSILASDVIQMLAEERGLSPTRIEPSSRLFEDLGMDGDDAVEFFMILEERFGTDLSALRERWGDHFGPEGVSCWNGLVIMPAAMIGGVAAAFLNMGTAGGIAITVALLALWFWAIKMCSPPDKMQPITVEQVIAAVEAGAWPRRD